MDALTIILGLNLGILIGIVVSIKYLMKVVSGLTRMVDKLEKLEKKIINMEDEEIDLIKKKK